MLPIGCWHWSGLLQNSWLPTNWLTFTPFASGLQSILFFGIWKVLFKAVLLPAFFSWSSSENVLPDPLRPDPGKWSEMRTLKPGDWNSLSGSCLCLSPCCKNLPSALQWRKVTRMGAMVPMAGVTETAWHLCPQSLPFALPTCRGRGERRAVSSNNLLCKIIPPAPQS